MVPRLHCATRGDALRGWDECCKLAVLLVHAGGGGGACAWAGAGDAGQVASCKPLPPYPPHMYCAWGAGYPVMSDARQMHVRYMSDAHQMHIRCMSDACPMHVRCVSDAHQMHVRYMSDAHQMHVRCTSDACPMHIRCISDACPMHVRYMSDARQMHFRCTSSEACRIMHRTLPRVQDNWA